MDRRSTKIPHPRAALSLSPKVRLDRGKREVWVPRVRSSEPGFPGHSDSTSVPDSELQGTRPDLKSFWGIRLRRQTPTSGLHTPEFVEGSQRPGTRRRLES